MADWRDRLLGEVITLHRGFDLPSRMRTTGSIPVVSSSGITGWHGSAKVSPPGVVTGRYGTLGRVFYVDQPFWPLNTTLYVSEFNGHNPRFVAYILEGMDLARYDGAAAVPGLDRNVLHRIQVRWPDRPTQAKVATVLAVHDELIKNNLRRIAILEEMAKAVYREWFLDFQFPGHQSAELVESDSTLRPVPSGWHISTVGDACELNPRVRLHSDATYSFIPMGSLVPWSMRVDGVENRVGPSGAQFTNGDTLLARINPSLENGKTSFVQCLSNREVGCGSTEFIVLRSRTLTPEFVYLLARTDGLRETAIGSMVGASGRQRVQESSVASYKFAHPSRDVLEAFTAAVRPMFKLVQNLADQNASLGATRDLLLPRLVTGELDVSEVEVDTEWLAS